MANGTRVVAYLRRDDDDTVQQQRFSVALWCGRNHAEVVHELVDEDPLGGRRPRLRIALEAVEGGEADALVVASLGVLDDDPARLASILERAAIVAVQDGLDLRDPWAHALAVKVLRAVVRIGAAS
jgi:hypothetical protein